MKTLTKTNERRLNDNRKELINMCNGKIGMVEAINEMIVQVLNEKKDEILNMCNNEIKDIRFRPTSGIIEKQKMYNGVLLENITVYQAININIMDDKNSIKNAITLYLKDDKISYNTFEGLSDDAIFEILHTIADIGDLEYTIVGKDKYKYVINDCDKAIKIRTRWF